MIGIARANTNIALIKYWGKKDKHLFLPMNSSLSLTLDAFYTDTKVVFDPTLTEDVFFLNNKLANTAKITPFLDLFRQKMTTPFYARVDSLNFVPTAAGLASSASAFAALAGAVNQASGLHLPLQELSTYARRGSGSATRSLYGGFVEWQKGTASHNSIAVPLDNADWGIGMFIVIVNTKEKAISSRVGMDLTVETSPFYSEWVKSTEHDLIQLKQAIAKKDFQTIGEITEHNGMKMHATMLSANPPFCYFEPDSLLVQQQVRLLRQQGIPVYFTMDAGPNVKLLCKTQDMPFIRQHFLQFFPPEKLVSSGVGKGLRSLSDEEWQESQHRFLEKYYD